MTHSKSPFPTAARWIAFAERRLVASDREGAKAGFLMAAALDPGIAEGWAGLARLALAEADLGAAAGYLRRAVDEDPAGAGAIGLRDRLRLSLLVEDQAPPCSPPVARPRLR